METSKNLSLFEELLNNCLTNKKRVSVVLINNNEVTGKVVKYDTSCIVVESFQKFYIPIHSIAYVSVEC